MPVAVLEDALAIRAAIAEHGFDIYRSLTDHPKLVYARPELEALLSHELIGRVFEGPNKARGKAVKQAVAAALGYPVPASLRRIKPRFPGQDLEVHTQQSRNLQIYNEEVSPTRRYVVVGLNSRSEVTAVRVIEGAGLEKLDTTGTLTSKFQAKRLAGRTGSRLVSQTDTPSFVAELSPAEELSADVLRPLAPNESPKSGCVLSVAALHMKLLGLVGREFPYAPSERQRGDELHRAACDVLGLGSHADTGRFPDIVCQALEVKLQLAGTIDLGLVSPDSEEPAVTLSPRLRHCDARYLVAYATRHEGIFRVDCVVTSTGAAFFDEFRRFGGLVENRKLQIPLPRDFYETE